MSDKSRIQQDRQKRNRIWKVIRGRLKMKKFKRIFTIVIDSLGAGALPDAGDYGDTGADTLGQRNFTFRISRNWE